jgi:hypothetical protein
MRRLVLKSLAFVAVLSVATASLAQGEKEGKGKHMVPIDPNHATKVYVDSTFAPTANPHFTGSVSVPKPSSPGDASNKSYVDSMAGYVKYAIAEEYTVTTDMQPLPGLSPAAGWDEGTVISADCWLVVKRDGNDPNPVITFGLTGSGSVLEAEISKTRQAVGGTSVVTEIGKGGLSVAGPNSGRTSVYHLTIEAMTASKPGTVILSVAKRNNDAYVVLPTSRCQWSTK